MTSQLNKPNHLRGGFSLVELLVTMAIIAILISGLVVGIAYVTSSEGKTEDKQLISNLGVALQKCATDRNGKYPPSDGTFAPGVIMPDGKEIKTGAQALVRALVGDLDPVENKRNGYFDGGVRHDSYWPYDTKSVFEEDPAKNDHLVGPFMMDRFGKPILYYAAIEGPAVPWSSNGRFRPSHNYLSRNYSGHAVPMLTNPALDKHPKWTSSEGVRSLMSAKYILAAPGPDGRYGDDIAGYSEDDIITPGP